MNEQPKLETTEEFNILTRKEKLAILKQGIKATHLAITEAVNMDQRLSLYNDLGKLLMTQNEVKMNKHNSKFFEFIPNPSGTNRAERRRRK